MKKHLKFCFQIILWLSLEQVLQDVAAVRSSTSPKTGSSVFDAELMFEFLLGGVEIDHDNNIVLLDKEMASMRMGRAFLSQINDNIPRSPSSMDQMAWHHEREEQRKAWSDVLLQLANVTVNELRGSNLFSYA
ncbi:hypothetical protein PBY51_011812 [Eleginops maclovinus]|uniref:Uncharacterized protein n=1 Tax=Eleginops maclovinus TaxID=56733 RepID=A0AAN7XTU2_ELEMC|nr:hypothetical protein PBY51_011812 [Eleginops maclovinus]